MALEGLVALFYLQILSHQRASVQHRRWYINVCRAFVTDNEMP